MKKVLIASALALLASSALAAKSGAPVVPESILDVGATQCSSNADCNGGTCIKSVKCPEKFVCGPPKM